LRVFKGLRQDVFGRIQATRGLATRKLTTRDKEGQTQGPKAQVDKILYLMQEVPVYIFSITLCPAWECPCTLMWGFGVWSFHI
jgi:hypothetical protein